ncbi:hypothetical protein [Roseateles sp.]|uniref:hypothetical protein n=1 Tax=Roseateles sp. TaxID=1971397 RepID=UPI003D0E3512
MRKPVEKSYVKSAALVALILAAASALQAFVPGFLRDSLRVAYNVLRDLGPSLFAGATLVVLVQQTRLLRHSKIVEMMWQANSRFEAVSALRFGYQAKPDCAQETKEAALAFFFRFWSLQLDQFDSWQLGFIPDEIYMRWLAQRQAEYKKEDDGFPFGGYGQPGFMSFREGWERVSGSWNEDRYHTFKNAMEAAMRYAGPSTVIVARGFLPPASAPHNLP